MSAAAAAAAVAQGWYARFSFILALVLVCGVTDRYVRLPASRAIDDATLKAAFVPTPVTDHPLVPAKPKPAVVMVDHVRESALSAVFKLYCANMNPLLCPFSRLLLLRTRCLPRPSLRLRRRSATRWIPSRRCSLRQRL